MFNIFVSTPVSSNNRVIFSLSLTWLRCRLTQGIELLIEIGIDFRLEEEMLVTSPLRLENMEFLEILNYFGENITKSLLG